MCARGVGNGLASSGGSFPYQRRMPCLFEGGRGTHTNAADEVMVRLDCFLSLSKSMAAQA